VVSGVFDISISNGAIGQFITFLQELKCISLMAGEVPLEIVLYFVNLQPSGGIPTSADSNRERVRMLASIARALLSIEDVVNLVDVNVNLAEVLQGQLVWPSVNSLTNRSFNYDTTLRVAKLWEQGGVQRFCPDFDFARRVSSVIERHSKNGAIISLHLKCIHGLAEGNSNADLNTWRQIISLVSTLRPSDTFFLVGDEESNCSFLDLPNVVVAKSIGLSIADQLVLILKSSLFLGMMSGFSVVAIFGDAPYIIFKNPDHHRVEMDRELSKDGGFPFSVASQLIYRILEADLFLEELVEKIVSILSDN